MKQLKRFFSLSALVLAGATAFAIPAKLGVVAYTQPDGSTVNIRLHGNGDLHFTTTEDGTLLTMTEDGFYHFADVTDDGKIISTGVKASNAPTLTGVKLTDVRSKISNARKANADPARTNQSGMGKYQNNYPLSGEVRVPIILVEFKDVKFSEGYPEYFRNMVNGDFKMYDCPGNLEEYFEFQSHGKFTPKFDVYGPITLPQNIVYYANNAGQGWDVYANKMIGDAAKQLYNEQHIDFTQYNFDNDNEVDLLYVVYAGYSEARGYDPNLTIWPNAGKIQKNGNYVLCGDMWINSYACSNELISEGEFEGMANIIHEYSHVIGLPDLYPTGDTFHYNTPGPYSILDYGVYVNEGRTPPNFGAYERNALEWDYPISITGQTTMELQDISTGEFALIPTSKSAEFFLFENRQNKGWDTHLPHHGLVIYHIDYSRNPFESNEVNVDMNHQRVDLIEANNTPGFNVNYGKEDANCAEWTFPGKTENTEFTFDTEPSFQTWDGVDLNLPITNIREINNLAIFDVAGGDPNYVEPVPEFPDDEITGVSDLKADADGTFVVYNMTGVKVMTAGNEAALSSLPAGLYIINGKKVIVRK